MTAVDSPAKGSLQKTGFSASPGKRAWAAMASGDSLRVVNWFVVRSSVPEDSLLDCSTPGASLSGKSAAVTLRESKLEWAHEEYPK